MKKNIYNILFFTLFAMLSGSSYASFKVSGVDSNANILLEGDKTIKLYGIYIPTALKGDAIDYIKKHLMVKPLN